MFGNTRYDVVAFVAIRFGNALNRDVVTLCGPGGENNFFRLRADQSGYTRACGLHGLFCGPAERVTPAGGIAEFVG